MPFHLRCRPDLLLKPIGISQPKIKENEHQELTQRSCSHFMEKDLYLRPWRGESHKDY